LRNIYLRYISKKLIKKCINIAVSQYLWRIAFLIYRVFVFLVSRFFLASKLEIICRLPYVLAQSMENEIVWPTAYFRSEKFNNAEFSPECRANYDRDGEKYSVYSDTDYHHAAQLGFMHTFASTNCKIRYTVFRILNTSKIFQDK